MQNSSRPTKTSRASRAVHGCSYNQRKLNNLLEMLCLDHKLFFLRKECEGINREGQSHKTVSRDHNFWREKKRKKNGEPNGFEPKSLCLPA